MATARVDELFEQMPFGDDKKADAIIAKAIAKAEEGDTALGFTGSPAALALLLPFNPSRGIGCELTHIGNLYCTATLTIELKINPMSKARKTLIELERIVRTALHNGGATVVQIAIAPAAAQTSEANWTLLHIDSERTFDPMFRELIRPIQARYDLSW
jgi:hypothetical protein